jgi:ribulose-phosphate 3-epimerase
MSVNPGFGGQAFIPSAYAKIRRIKQMLGARPVDLSVDGGVKRDHVRPLAEAGATVLVAGSAIFGDPDPAAVVKEMKRLADS